MARIIRAASGQPGPIEAIPSGRFLPDMLKSRQVAAVKVNASYQIGPDQILLRHDLLPLCGQFKMSFFDLAGQADEVIGKRRARSRPEARTIRMLRKWMPGRCRCHERRMQAGSDLRIGQVSVEGWGRPVGTSSCPKRNRRPMRVACCIVTPNRGLGFAPTNRREAAKRTQKQQTCCWQRNRCRIAQGDVVAEATAICFIIVPAPCHGAA